MKKLANILSYTNYLDSLGSSGVSLLMITDVFAILGGGGHELSGGLVGSTFAILALLSW